MGTVIPRTRKDGSVSHIAQIYIKKGGRVHRECQTFDRDRAARSWIKAREAELRQPGGIEAVKHSRATISDAITTYIGSMDAGSRTKRQVLNAIKASFLGEIKCTELKCDDVILYARQLLETVQPQTCNNYLSHLSAVFSLARPAWGYPIDPQIMKDVFVVAKKMRMTAKSTERYRRPTLDELDRLMTHFVEAQAIGRAEIPMEKMVAFALFSTRRQNEITRLQWDDLDAAKSRILVRNMKNPGQTKDNHVLCDLPAPCLDIIAAMPRTDKFIFPFNGRSVSAAFTRACAFLEIEDLHFHDLRHEGVSRLFEMEWSIPKVAQVSGHRSWVALKRYTHIDSAGDKYAAWPWLERVTSRADGAQ